MELSDDCAGAGTVRVREYPEEEERDYAERKRGRIKNAPMPMMQGMMTLPVVVIPTSVLQHAVGNLLLDQDEACVELVLVDEPAAVLVDPGEHHEALLLRELELVVLQNLLELVHVQAARGSLSSPLFCFLHALAAFCLNCA